MEDQAKKDRRAKILMQLIKRKREKDAELLF